MARRRLNRQVGPTTSSAITPTTTAHLTTQATIHIGLPKTGTTSIQRFLRINASRLKKLGFSYPHFLERENHLQLAMYGVGLDGVHMAHLIGLTDADQWRSWRSDFRHRLLAKTAAGGHWLFSSEHIVSRLTKRQQIADLSSLLSEAFEDLHLVLYVRRQDDMALAFYSTWVRDGRSEPFDVEDALYNADRYDFKRIIEKWREACPKSKVTVRLYPDSQSSTTLIDDFKEVVGIPDDPELELPPRLNTSFSAPELEFLRKFNALVPRLNENGQRIERYGNPARWVAGSIPGPPARLSRAHSTAIMQHYEDSNQWVLQQTDSPGQHNDYFEPRQDTGGGVLINEIELDADQVIGATARLWKRLMDEYNELSNQVYS